MLGEDSRGPRSAARTQGLPLELCLGVFRLMRRYNRYEVSGLERLPRDRAALIVGYHGRPVAWDLFMLSVSVYERDGYLPHAIFHSGIERIPPARWMVHGLGGLYGDGERVRAIVARGEHILTAPGGTREGLRSAFERYRVAWGQRTGYLRFALKYALPIVPVGASGVDSMYLGLFDGYRLGKRLGMPDSIPLWVGFGLTGLAPLALPFPVRVKQIIGEPIMATADGSVDPDDREALGALHRRVANAVQAAVDQARGSAPGQERRG